MFARLLLLATMAVPLEAQSDGDVAKYLEELRAKNVESQDLKAEWKRELAAATKSLEAATDRKQKAFWYGQISNLEQSLGDPDEALTAARRAHELTPEDAGISILLAQVLVASKQSEEAAALLGADPTDGGALVRRAEELADRGEMDFAAGCARLAQKILPDDPGVSDTLGNIYMRTGKADDAVLVLNRAVGKAPEISLYHYHLAQAFAQKGYRGYARTELQTALACHPPEEIRAAIHELSAKVEPVE